MCSPHFLLCLRLTLTPYDDLTRLNGLKLSRNSWNHCGKQELGNSAFARIFLLIIEFSKVAGFTLSRKMDYIRLDRLSKATNKSKAWTSRKRLRPLQKPISTNFYSH